MSVHVSSANALEDLWYSLQGDCTSGLTKKIKKAFWSWGPLEAWVVSWLPGLVDAIIAAIKSPDTRLVWAGQQFLHDESVNLVTHIYRIANKWYRWHSDPLGKPSPRLCPRSALNQGQNYGEMEGKLTEISCMILCMPLGVTMRSELLFECVLNWGGFGHVWWVNLYTGRQDMIMTKYFEAPFLPAHNMASRYKMLRFSDDQKLRQEIVKAGGLTVAKQVRLKKIMAKEKFLEDHLWTLLDLHDFLQCEL